MAATRKDGRRACATLAGRRRGATAATIFGAALLLAVGGCASRESRIETELTRAGLPVPVAQCMAPRLGRNLSNDQLRQLGRLSTTVRTPHAGTESAIRAIVADLDPQAVGVVLRAGLACAAGG